MLGYCFGADYIVVYKSVPGGEQLFGNSSQGNLPGTLPADLQGRIYMSNDTKLLGMMINDLKEPDSGTYRRECWLNQTVISNHSEHLTVCRAEVSSEIIRKNEGGAEILCNSSSIGPEGTSVRWYHDAPPQYKTTLFLDTGVSMEPLTADLRGVVKAEKNGTLLVVDKTVLEKFQNVYCVVFKDKTCLDLINISPPDVSRIIFASKGDRVVLNCPTDDNQQYWDTPLGEININSTKDNQMYVSAADEPRTFSLIIPAGSDEHTGTYSCISTSADLEYSLYFCPKSQPREKLVHTGEGISLECDFDRDSRSTVQWYHRVGSNPYILLGELADSSNVIAEHLKGRAHLNESGLLTISDLKLEDEGVYRCVAFTGPEYLDYGDFEDSDDDGEAISEDYATDSELTDKTMRCTLKQETTVKVSFLEERDFKPEEQTDVIKYALVGGLVGLVVVAIIIAVVVVKRQKPKSRDVL